MDFILETSGDTAIFVDYDWLCADPEPALAAIASALRLMRPAELIANAKTIRQRTSYLDQVPPEQFAAKAHALYQRALERAIRLDA